MLYNLTIWLDLSDYNCFFSKIKTLLSIKIVIALLKNGKKASKSLVKKNESKIRLMYLNFYLLEV